MATENFKDLFKGSLTVPNLLSFLRIVMVPFLIYFFLNDMFIAAVVILFLSGLSDFLDGKIARRFNQISALGKVLDPIADKLTQISLAVMLFITFHGAENELLKAFSWVFLVFIIKEAVMVVGGSLMIAFGMRPGAAEFYGKLATMIFYIVMFILILFGPEVGAFNFLFTIPDVVVMIMVGVSAVLTIVAFFSYMPGTFRQIKERFSKK